MGGSHKAPGKGFLLPKLFKTHIDWWGLLLAGLFIHINNIGCIPVGWEVTIIVLYKKEGKGDPKKIDKLYWSCGKMYVILLLSKIEGWIMEINL